MTLRCSELLDRAGSYFHGRAAYSQAAPLLARCAGDKREGARPRASHTATSLNNLAVLLTGPGRLCRGAAALRARAGDTRKGARPRASRYGGEPQQPRLPAPGQGDLAGARPLFERALAIREKVLGPEHPLRQTSLNNLASCSRTRATLQRRGRSTSARWRYARRRSAPSIPTTAAEPQQPRRPAPGQGDFAGARPLFERALAIHEKALGPEHPDTATSLNNLAVLLQDQGDLAGARPLYERALAIYEKALGPEHPDTAMSMSNLARVLRDTGRPQRSASRCSARRSPSREKALGRDHPVTQRLQAITRACSWRPGAPPRL